MIDQATVYLLHQFTTEMRHNLPQVRAQRVRRAANAGDGWCVIVIELHRAHIIKPHCGSKRK